MKKFFLVFISFLLMITSSFSHNCNWATKIGGLGSETVDVIAHDSSGYTIIGGAFYYDDCVFTPSITLNKVGTSNLFLAKYFEDTCLWAVSITGSNYQYIYDIATDKNGNIYITGYYDSPTLNFNNSISLTNNNYSNGFLAKFDSNGVCQWAERIYSNSDALSYDLLVDNNNNIFVSGYYWGASLNFNNGISLSNVKNADSFLAKYNSSGQCIWAENIGGYGNDNVLDIAKDSDNNIYVVGYYSGDGISLNNGIFLNSPSGADGFIIKYNNNGVCLWADKIYGYNFDIAINIAIDNHNKIRVMGLFSSPSLYANNDIELISGHQNGDDIYCVTYDTAGVCSSIIYILGDFDNYMHRNYLSFDSLGNYYLSLTYRNKSLNINGEYNLPLFNNADIFIAKFDTNDHFVWAKKIAGNFNEYENSILVYDENKLLLGGHFNSLELSFTDDIKLTNNSSQYYYDEGFLANISDCNLSVKHSISLISGWNMISTYIDPTEKSMPTIWNDIKNSVNLVKDISGKSYIPSFNINQIGDWNKYQGYQVYMNQNKTLEINGTELVPENTPISLSSGWSMIPYMRKSDQSIVTALATLTSGNVLNIAKDISGKSYIPQFNINQIGNMQPGQGYQVYLSKNSTLTYPANSSGKELAREVSPMPKHLIPEYNRTGNSAVAIFSIEANNGDEIGIYNRSGELIGSGAIKDNLTAVTIWGDNSQTPNIDGAVFNEELTIKYYNSRTNKFENIELSNITDYLSGNEILGLNYSNDAVFYLKVNVESKNNNLSLSVSPNPIKDNIEISIETSDCSASNLKIYDLSGRMVQNLTSKLINSNNQTLKVNLSNLPNGEYTIVLTCGNLKVSEKLIIMK